MKSKHKINRILLVLGIGLIAILLSSCSGGAFGASSWPGISTDGSDVYIAFNQAIIAINGDTGVERWRFPSEPERTQTFFSPPVISDELLIVGGYDNVVYAVNKTSRNEQWRFEGASGRIIGGLVIFENYIFVPSADGTLYVLNLDNGALVWSFETEQAIWSTPLIKDERVFVTSMDHFVYALDIENGELIWKQELSASITDSVSIADDLLLVGTLGSQVVALNVDNGAEIWRFDTEGWVWGSPTIVDDVAYFGDVQGNLYGVSTRRGEQQATEKLDGPITASPLLIEDTMYFFTQNNGTVYARDIVENIPKWQVSVNASIYSKAIIRDNLLIVSTIDTESSQSLIIGINKDTGNQIWTFNLE
jgi:outer membrane protein assembly factor BamB